MSSRRPNKPWLAFHERGIKLRVIPAIPRVPNRRRIQQNRRRAYVEKLSSEKTD